MASHKFYMVGHESLDQCFTNRNEYNSQENECSRRRGHNLARTGTDTKQAEGDAWEAEVEVLPKSGNNNRSAAIHSPPTVFDCPMAVLRCQQLHTTTDLLRFTSLPGIEQSLTVQWLSCIVNNNTQKKSINDSLPYLSPTLFDCRMVVLYTS